MIFSKNGVKNLLGLAVGAGALISCSEHNAPQRKGNEATFYVSTFEAPADFFIIGEPNAQGKYNKRQLPLEVCLKDKAQTNSLSNLRFDIVAENNVMIERTTDSNGCLQWQELVEFDPDGDSENLPMNRSIVAKESHSGTYKIMFTIDPINGKFSKLIRNGTYVEQGGSTVSYKIQHFASAANANNVAGGSDSNQVFYLKVESGNLAHNRSTRKARQTEVETLNLESKGVDFYNLKLDQKLNIVFPYVYYTRFSIFLLRQKLEGRSGEAIKSGRFRFYLTVLKDNANLKNPQISDVLSAVEFDGSPRGDAGLITVPITLNFSNVTSISNRVNFLFTVVSSDTPVLFPAQEFEGYSKEGLVANADLAIKLYPSEGNAQSLVAGYTQKIAQENEVSKISIEDALGQEGLEKITSPWVKFSWKDTPTSVAVTKDLKLKTMIDNLSDSRNLSIDEKRALCAAYYQGKIQSLEDANYIACLTNPSAHLEASITEIVESVEPNVVSDPVIMDTETFNMTSEFVISSASSTAKGHEGEGAVDGKVGVGFKPFDKDKPLSKGWIGGIVAKVLAWTTGITPVLEVNATLSGKAYVSNKSETKQSNDKTGKIVQEKVLTSTPLVITFNAKALKCMVIVRKASNSSSRYVCGDRKSISRTEYYYLVDYAKADKAGSVVIDKYSGVVNPFHMLVRGKDTYTSLRDTLSSTGTMTTFWISKIDEKKLEDASNYMTQSAPMVLSTRTGLLSK